MPLTPMRFNADIPKKTVCINCPRRQLHCHKFCEDYVMESIVAIIAETDARKRKQENYEMCEVVKHRMKKGLFE